MNHELSREILGNIGRVSLIVFYLLSFASLSCFAYGVWRRLRLWRMGRAHQVSFGWSSAIRRLINDVLLQRSMRSARRPASIAHAALFAGFALLFVGTVLIAVEHYGSLLVGRPHTDPLFHKGIYYAVFELTLDIAGVLLVAGCIYFGCRRMRQTSSMEHRASDYLVLASLIAIALTGYAIEGARIVREDTAWAGLSPVGFCVAQTMVACGTTIESVSRMHWGLWWVHTIAALGLIAAIPYCRLLHIVAGVANVAVRNAPLGVMEPISIEQVEADGRVGVGQVSDFARGQLLALDACVSCGRCEDACPAHVAGKPLSPRNVVQDLRCHVEQVARAAGNGEHCDMSIPGKVISTETVWSCTTCGACVNICPLRVAPLEFITDMRRNLVAEGHLSGPPAVSLQKMQRSGNPWGLPPAERFSWADGLEVPTVADNPHFDVLYWVGCAASYDRRIQKVAKAVVQLLRLANVNFACLGPKERCTGDSARRMGDEFLFQQLADENIATLTKHNVRHIVTHCPHCLNSLTKDYAQFGGNFKVQHHSEFLAELIADSRLQVDNTLKQSVTFHDPCYLARVNNISDAPRQVLAATISSTHGASLTEMPRCRVHTACCGAGGGRMWFDDTSQQRLGLDRVEEAMATGAETVAVGCPFCLTMMSDGLAMNESNTSVKDIAELLAEAIGDA